MAVKKPKIYTLNKGEWSEAYCLIKVIADGQLKLVDDNLENNQEALKIAGGKIAFHQSTQDYSYSINGEIITISDQSNDVLILNLDIFKALHSIILKRILTTGEKTFTIDEVQAVFAQVGALKLKSGALNKEDLTFKIIDPELPTEEHLGFSVKSFLAGSPTLVNASGATNFNYKTTIGKGNISAYGDLKTKSLLRKLSEDNQSVQYTEMNSKVYEKNLMLIDTNMPKIIAEALKIYFSGKVSMVCDVVSILKANNPLKLSDVSIYENKIKDFLFNSALGVFPDKPWDGLRSVDGGCIVISSNGDLGTFYIVRKVYLEFFREYLFKRCYFDTASTTRHKFGRLILNDKTNQYLLKLNLQIRVKNK